MNYTKILKKVLHTLRKHPTLWLITLLITCAPWLQTTLQGTLHWTEKGLSVQWNNLPNPYSVIVIGTLFLLWFFFRATRKNQLNPQNPKLNN